MCGYIFIFRPPPSSWAIGGVATHFVLKCCIVLMSDALGEASGAGMSAAAMGDVVRLVVTYGCHWAVTFSKWTHWTKISARSARDFSLLRLLG
jgi:hypothetical protein